MNQWRLGWMLMGVALSAVSCGSSLWNRPVDELKSELALGNTSFVLSLTPKDFVETDLGSLGEGAAWNLGTLFSDADRMDEAELLWKRSLSSEAGPWRDAAGRDLFDLYSSRRDWPKAEALAQKLVGMDGGRQEFRRMLFEAYYFQKKDDLAAEIFRSWKPGTFAPAEERENQLFAAVLAARAGRSDEAAALLRPLVFEQEASVLHFRLESFFQEDESRYELLGPGGREAVAFQSLVYQGVAKDTLAWFKGKTFPKDFWNRRALIAGIETAFKAESRAESGLRILATASPGLTGEAKFAALYARGRFYRSLGWWSQARSAFQVALPFALSKEDRQRTAWNWLNACVETQPEEALGPFVQVYSATDDPRFFDDVFENWVTQLVQGRRWQILASAQRDLARLLPATDQAMLGFVLVRLSSHGLVDLVREGITTSPAQLLEQAVAADPFSYEALMALAVLGRPLEWPQAGSPASFSTDDRGRDQLRVWESLAHFGLAKRLGSEVAASTRPLDPEFAMRMVVWLQANQQFRPSLQVLYRLLKEPGQVLTKERARLLYPNAFAELAGERASAEKLEVSLLLGLMREESSFDPRARSWVGAQGLTQLMPATAAETAKGLRMKTYDLASPADNIKIGARYLSTMIRTQGRIYLALMAYNAGGGRIKPWKAAMGRLPEEIFVEAVPIPETRGYVKKILVATVMTGMLHYGKTLDEMVRLIYPGFEP